MPVTELLVLALLGQIGGRSETLRPPAAQDQGPTLVSLGLSPYFVSQSTEKFTFPNGKDDTKPVFDVGVAPAQHMRLIDEVSLSVYRNMRPGGTDFLRISHLLDRLVSEIMQREGVNGTNYPLLRKWLLAEAVAAFCVSKVDYALDQAEATFDSRKRSALNEPESFMALDQPRAVCSGYTRLAAILSRDLGLNCCHIDGFTRGRNRDWNHPNHGWLLYDFGQGVRVPADVTSRIQEFSSGRTLANTDFAHFRRKYDWRILPRAVRDWELFGWLYYQYRLVPEEKSAPPNLSMTRVSFDDWRMFGATGAGLLNRQYGDLLRWYQHRDDQTLAGN